jgi:hypothetical protein
MVDQPSRRNELCHVYDSASQLGHYYAGLTRVTRPKAKPKDANITIRHAREEYCVGTCMRGRLTEALCTERSNLSFARNRSVINARRLLKASVLYLALWLGFILLNASLP